MSQNKIDQQEELNLLINTLPNFIQNCLFEKENLEDLLEVVLDLGRQPEARFPNKDIILDSKDIIDKDIQYVVNKVGEFGGDNRAGIERTLHRISAIRNRKGTIIGLTLRVGRTLSGTINPILDHVVSGRNILILGKPGVGKTTMLREVARVLSDEVHKRVIIVDTSNEIAGDGDIPHPAIGHSRRMQVPTPIQQHTVMIEAIENHMPEVIIIDEMGTELEAIAARTIAERGVQLVATAHGNTLSNLIMNPTLSDLVGGVQTVTLGDNEANRRGTQKSILERKAPPTFEVVVEIKSWGSLVVHPEVRKTVDDMLRSMSLGIDKSRRISEKETQITTLNHRDTSISKNDNNVINLNKQHTTCIYPFGVNRGRLYKAIKDIGTAVNLVSDLKDSDILLTTKHYYKRGHTALKQAQHYGTPVYVLRRNTTTQIEHFLKDISRGGGPIQISKKITSSAILEAEDASHRILSGERIIALNPQVAYIRKLQHIVADRYNLLSLSQGEDPTRHVVLHPK